MIFIKYKKINYIMTELIITQYSEKAIVVRGDTKKFENDLTNIGGKWNPSLKNGGAGWIFPNTRKVLVEELNEKIKKGTIKGDGNNNIITEKTLPRKKEEKSEYVTREEHTLLYNQFLKLEQEFNKLKKIYGNNESICEEKSNNNNNSESDEESEDEDVKKPSLLHRKK